MKFTTLWTHPAFDGTLKLEHDGTRLHYASYVRAGENIDAPTPAPLFLNPILEWLTVYATSPLTTGEVCWASCPRISGTPFQESVWDALNSVPAGTTLSYQQLAIKAGHPARSARAVAGAVARNPFIILIPCHRILRHSGELGGYSGDGGTTRKRQLLHHEGITI